MLLCPFVAFTQSLEDLENVDLSKLKGQLKERLTEYKEKTPLEISGGVALNTVATALTQGENSQPISFVASGNVLFTIKGYKLPFSFTYSNWKFAKTNPSFRFNKFSFQPKLKNTGLLIGDASMSFSPYTLNGFQFTGAGIEQTPGKFKIQAMAGRFMKAVAEDTSNQITPSFKRLGAGVKVGYSNKNRKLGFAAFYAKDDKLSIPIPTNIFYEQIRPKENLALSIEAGLPLAKQLTWEGEIAASVLTENTLSNETQNMVKNPLTQLLKNRNTTTKVYPAMKSNINYIIGQEGMIGVGYERVAPDYRTLGGYYFTNDFENITVNAQHRGKVNMGLSTGIQYDNLNNQKASNSGRMVISTNTAFKVSEAMALTMNYSNFQSFTFVRTGFERINRINPYDNLDTLNFTLLTQNAMIAMNYNFKQDSSKARTFNMNVNFMESSSQRSGLTLATPQLNNGSKFINGGMNYSVAQLSKNLTIMGGLNLSYNYGGISNTVTAGPVVAVSKMLFDKTVTTNGAFAYNISRTVDVSQHIVTLNIGASTCLDKKHNITVNLLGQQRMGNTTKPALMFTGSVGYNYSFGYKVKKLPFSKETKVMMNDE